MNADLYFDSDGVLITLAQYERTVAGKKRVVLKEIEALEEIMKGLRPELDVLRCKYNACIFDGGRMSSKDFWRYEHMRELHGRAYRNVKAAKSLLLKWVYMED